MSFEIDSPVEFNVVMPENSVIVGMSTFPIDMNVDSDRTKILLPSGPAEITYFLAVAEPSQVLPPEETPVTADNDNSMMYGRWSRCSNRCNRCNCNKDEKQTRRNSFRSTNYCSCRENEPFNIEKVLEMPDLREDDKDIIKFIHENGGSALESDLRKIPFTQNNNVASGAKTRKMEFGFRNH